MPEGRETEHEFEMSPYRNPTPTNPFVCSISHSELTPDVISHLQLNPVMLGQDKLEKIFHSALAVYGCSVELGTELQSFEQTSSSVKVKLIKRGFSQDPNSGELEESIVDWMIGTDGARGVVRKQLGLAFLGETRNVENFIVGDIYVEGLSQEVRLNDLWSCFLRCLICVIFSSIGICGATLRMFCT